jgi:hypothetical protein
LITAASAAGAAVGVAGCIMMLFLLLSTHNLLVLMHDTAAVDIDVAAVDDVDVAAVDGTEWPLLGFCLLILTCNLIVILLLLLLVLLLLL